jgi:hypothetical protein
MTHLLGSDLLDYLGPLGGRQSCQRTKRLWQGGCSVRAIAAAADLGIWHLGEVLAAQRRRHVYPISIAAAQLASPAHCHPATYGRMDPPTAVISCGVSSLGQRSREVFEVSLSSMWLAVFKMMHRSVGRKGYGQLLTAFAALTDRERTRQNFSSALWAPLTLRLSPGATSFQHQPTREETT